MHRRTILYALLPLVLIATVIVYAGGLDGPFLFDDHIHITQNRWVKIDNLDWSSLVQAWNSSFSPFPVNRPLAQLSFGLNHAVAGLDPFAFKLTNLVLHLIAGVLVLLLSRLVVRALNAGAPAPRRELLVGIMVMAFWLLHPIHVSTVFYTVQRMAQISAIGMFGALAFYLWGRLRIAAGSPGILWMVASVPMALVGFLGKENAALLPLFLLVCELTLLQRIPTANARVAIRLIWVLLIALPLALAIMHIATHPNLWDYSVRPFTLEQRLLTEARVLWTYLQWLLVPNLAAFGLFHDDIALSNGLFSPPTTLLAILAWSVATVSALWLRKRYSVFAFALLFFLAAHALESTVIPLEIVFEHRNYLASFGPLFLLGYLVVTGAGQSRVVRISAVLGMCLLTAYASVTYLRVRNWSSFETFLLSSAENHPNSARSNFMAAQLLITALDKSKEETPKLAEAARTFLNKGLTANPRCINCMFGLVVLHMHLGQQPSKDNVRRLRDALRTGNVGATDVSITQFSFLVDWLRSEAPGLDGPLLESIFDAALENPGWNYTGRAGIHAAYREYHEFVSGDLEAALSEAELAIAAWPRQWSYHIQKAKVLIKLGRLDAALKALDVAATLSENQKQQSQMDRLRASIEQQRPG